MYSDRKKHKVNYIIYDKFLFDTDNSLYGKLPKGLFNGVKDYGNNNNVGCPAVIATMNRVFVIPCPVDLTVEWGIKNGEPYHNYEYKNFIPNSNVAKYFIDTCIASRNTNNIGNFQFLTPYAFVTDTKGIEVMTVPPQIKHENCKYQYGGFYIHSYVRQLNSNWVLIDKDKPAKIHFKKGEPLVTVYFNKSIDLNYMSVSETLENYIHQNIHIAAYKRGLADFTKQLFSRRPKSLM